MAAGIWAEAKGAMDWLVGQWRWPAACLFAGVMMLAMAPVWIYAAGAAIALIYLQLPLYMVHQFEEHTGDRFRKYLNQNVAHCEALTPEGTFWINALGVWGLELAMLYVAVFVDLSFALAAFYLPIVNALTHVREAAVRREYNPGLCTAVALFLPIAGWGLYRVSAESGATWGDHALGAGIAIAVHVAIIVYVVMRVRHLRSAPATG
jgi:Protein of unknown function with HXXEE motif